MRTLLFLLLLIAALPAMADSGGGPWSAPLSRDHPLVGRIWRPDNRQYIDEGELAERLVAADFVLLGERHDNPDHHRLQAWALDRIIAAGRRPLVAFEMVGPEQAAALERHLRDRPGDVAGLAETLDWTLSGWPAWEHYQPLFAAAVQAGLSIGPANLPRETMRAVARGQTLPADQQRFYGLDQPPPPPLFAAMAEEIRQSHCGQLPEQAVGPMVAVQWARDAAMAHALADRSPGGAVLIAGAGHTRIDRGVPLRLTVLAADRPSFSLAFIEVSDDETDPAGYGEAFGTPLPPFDAVWFTPRANDDDPCAEMTRFMQRKLEKSRNGAGKDE